MAEYTRIDFTPTGVSLNDQHRIKTIMRNNKLTLSTVAHYTLHSEYVKAPSHIKQKLLDMFDTLKEYGLAIKFQDILRQYRNAHKLRKYGSKAILY